MQRHPLRLSINEQIKIYLPSYNIEKCKRIVMSKLHNYVSANWDQVILKCFDPKSGHYCHQLFVRGTVGLEFVFMSDKDFVAKNLGWSPIQELAKPADAYTQSAYKTKCRHTATPSHLYSIKNEGKYTFLIYLLLNKLAQQTVNNFRK